MTTPALTAQAELERCVCLHGVVEVKYGWQRHLGTECLPFNAFLPLNAHIWQIFAV